MTELLAEQWKHCKDLIQDGLGDEDARSWLPSLELASISEKKAVLSGIPNAFFRSRIHSRFAPLLRASLAQCFAHTPLDDDFRVELRVGKGEGEDSARGGGEPPGTAGAGARGRTAERPGAPFAAAGAQYSFDDFVEAPSNRLALGAARAVAAGGGKGYNPLFLVAGTGMGKTHLLRAIAATAAANMPQGRIVYQTAEEFTNDMVEGIRRKRMNSVRRQYRTADMLLLDGVDFLQVSERSQEELLHTFDAVHGAGGRLVFSADRLPAAMTALHPTLRSRFQMGLVTEIAPAEHELRVRLLLTKARAQDIALTEEMADTLARRITSGIRPLEGALVRLLAYSSMLHEPITPEFMCRVAEPFFDREPEPQGLPVASESVFVRVCDRYEVTMKTLRSRDRSSNVARARRVAAYLLRELSTLSFPEIGTALGGRTHSTVIHAINNVRAELDSDPQFRHAMMKLRHELSGNAAAENL